MTTCFHIIEQTGQNQWQRVWFVEFTRWWHLGRSLPSSMQLVCVWELILTIHSIATVNSFQHKMQSETAYFGPGTGGGEFDQTTLPDWHPNDAATWWTRQNIRLSLVLAHSPYYVKTWRHPQNRKYITCCIAVRGGPSHDHSKQARHAYRNTSPNYRGEVKKCNSFDVACACGFFFCIYSVLNA